MKNKKSFFTMIVSIMFLFVLTACGSSENDAPKENTKKESVKKQELDAKQIFQEASKKNAALENADMNYAMHMKISQGEETFDMDLSMDMQLLGLNTDALQCAMSTVTTVSGQEIPAVIYYKDGYYYMEVSGQKIKYPFDVNEMKTQIENNMTTASFQTDSLKNLQAKEDGDNIILTFEADAKNMNDYVGNVLRSTNNSIDSDNFQIQKITGTNIIDKDGYCSKSDIKMLMNVDIEGTSAEMDITVTSNLTAVGDEVSISFPKDLESYMEVDPSLIKGQ